jgi:hypothetical protein
LLAKGSDVNLTNSKGRTALHYAAYCGHSAVVELLLAQEGINVNLKDSLGYTALHWAAIEGHQGVVELLLQNGADINEKNNSGNTALDLANNAIKDLLKSHTPENGGVAPKVPEQSDPKTLANTFKASYLTYKHSDEYVLSILKAICSSDKNKEEFSKALLTSLDDDSFAIYRLYNIGFGTEGNLKSWIQDALEEKYKELSSIESIFYAIWHFLEEYVIYPLFGDKEEPASGDGSALVGEVRAT